MAAPQGDRDEKLKEADRVRYRDEAVSLKTMLADAISAASGIDDRGIWEVYARTEKLIAVLKFRLDYETPGAFTTLPEVGDPVRLLEEARTLLTASADEMSSRKMVEAVETLRRARTSLRSYLTEKRKAATKADRQARGRPATR